VKTLDKAQLF
jgi:cathepsin C